MAVLSDEYPAGFADPPHMHTRGQFVYACEGLVSILAQDASFSIPPQRAVWVPAGVEHEGFCRGAASLRTLYIAQDAHPLLPNSCRVLEVSSFLRELIVEAAHLPVEYALEGRERWIMDLILEEIVAQTQHAVAPLQVPMPRHPRLARLCREFMREPSRSDDVDDWAKNAGMGRRTFTRAFHRETRMSFVAWRQHVRLLEALSRLAIGVPVTTVALDVGYSTPSAFSVVFRKVFGVPPSQYLQSSRERRPIEDEAAVL